ncbi:unnamed protein product, partial [Prorocentrum cordatum]
AAPDLRYLGTPTPSRVGNTISSTSSRKLVGESDKSKFEFFVGQAACLPESSADPPKTARCGGSFLLPLWTLITVLRDPPVDGDEFDTEDFPLERVMHVGYEAVGAPKVGQPMGGAAGRSQHGGGDDLGEDDGACGCGAWDSLAADATVDACSARQLYDPGHDRTRAGTIGALELYRPRRQALKLLGVIGFILETRVSFVGWISACRDAFMELSETAQGWVTDLSEWAEWVRKLIPSQRWAATSASLVLMLLWGAHEMHEPEEPGQSSAAYLASGSAVGDVDASLASPPLPPPACAPLDAATLGHLNDLAESQRAAAAKLDEMRHPTKRAATEQPGAAQPAIERTQFKAQSPQQALMGQSEEFRGVPASEWATMMPKDFAGRIAADAPSEIYAPGKGAEARARDFTRDRGPMDCSAAREMTAIFAAADTMLMTDRQKGLLYQMSFERSAGQGRALARARRDAHSKDDWGQPKDATSRKSKAGREATRRPGPTRADKGAIRAAGAEEEAEKAAAKDSQLTKAPSDLDSAARRIGAPMSRRRDILSEASLPPRPEGPWSTPRWAPSLSREGAGALGRANRCLLAPGQLCRASPDDRPLDPEGIWGRGPLPRSPGGDRFRRALGGVRRQRLAEKLRLRPTVLEATQPQSNSKQRLAELRGRSAGGRGRPPDRGETTPALRGRAALPPPGPRPASAGSASPRAAQKLEPSKEEMSRGRGGDCAAKCEARNDEDRRFRRKTDMLQLAHMKATAGMLGQIPRKVDEFGLFRVVKEAEMGEDVGPNQGDFVVHGMGYAWPELQTGPPRSKRARPARHCLHLAGKGGPQPLEFWAVLDDAARSAGRVKEVDAAELALDAYRRSAEPFGLRASDILIGMDAGDQQVAALRLGVTERSERAKAGARQDAPIDRKHVAEMLIRRQMEREPTDRVFSCTVYVDRRASRRARE